MTSFYQRALGLIVLLFSLQVCALMKVSDYLDDNGNLTPHGRTFVNKASGSGSSSVPASSGNFHVDMSAKPYAIVNETAQFFSELNSQRTTIKYGPFDVPSMNQSDGMVDYLEIDMHMPCKGCAITWMQAGLEYPNGTYANANTSLWLHHVVMINYMRTDTVCGKNYYGKGQRWFASGNERTITDFSHSGAIPSAYFYNTGDMNIFLLELMNQEMATQQAVLTVTYEYIPAQPYDFYPITPIWLDIGGCNVASDMPPKSNTTFSYKLNQSYAITNWTGAIIGMGAHLHDGGVNVNITNNNVTICNSEAYYGGPGYIGPTMDMDDDMKMKRKAKRHGDDHDSDSSSCSKMSMRKRHGGDSMSGMSMSTTSSDGVCLDDDEMEHVSYMSSCYAPFVGQVGPGDNLGLEAYYNFTAHAGMTDTDGGLEDIMGISIVYVAQNMTAATVAKYVGAYTPNTEPPQPSYASALMHPAMATHMPSMDMGDDGPKVCRPASDSPGNLTSQGIDLTDEDEASDYLEMILDDACLQVWSNGYARAFWYGIVVVIGLFAIANTTQWALLGHKKRLVAAGKTPKPSSKFLSPFYSLYRSASYPAIGLSNTGARVLGLPALGTTLMIAVYMAFIVALNFIKADTHDDQRWQSYSVRAAWLSVAQLPLIILLTMKRNLISLVSGPTYERLNVFHRWTSRGLLLSATIHFGTQQYGWMRLGLAKLEWATDDCPITGIAAYAILLWMNLSTLRPVRNLSYEFFVIQHFVTWVGFVVALMIHIPDTAPFAKVYVWISIGIYVACKLVQGLFAVDRNRPSLSKASFNIASWSTSAKGDKSAVTKVTIKSTNLGRWTPGSHVRLSIPRYGFIESHPATILSTPSSHGGDLVFLLRAHNGFTQRIARSATMEPNATHHAIVDGPYGGISADLAAFETVVLIAGSTGITFTLPILLDLAERVSSGRTLPVRNVVFVWAVRQKDALKWVTSELQSAIASLTAHGINVELHVHVTSVTMRPFMAMLEKSNSNGSSPVRRTSDVPTLGGSEVSVLDEKNKEDGARPTQVRSKTVGSNSSRASNSSYDSRVAALKPQSGRPEIKKVIRETRERYEGEVGVAVCGPASMAAEARNAVAGLQWGSKGGEGVWLHVEGFAW